MTRPLRVMACGPLDNALSMRSPNLVRACEIVQLGLFNTVLSFALNRFLYDILCGLVRFSSCPSRLLFYYS